MDLSLLLEDSDNQAAGLGRAQMSVASRRDRARALEIDLATLYKDFARHSARSTKELETKLQSEKKLLQKGVRMIQEIQKAILESKNPIQT